MGTRSQGHRGLAALPPRHRQRVTGVIPPLLPRDLRLPFPPLIPANRFRLKLVEDLFLLGRKFIVGQNTFFSQVIELEEFGSEIAGSDGRQFRRRGPQKAR